MFALVGSGAPRVENAAPGIEGLVAPEVAGNPTEKAIPVYRGVVLRERWFVEMALDRIG